MGCTVKHDNKHQMRGKQSVCLFCRHTAQKRSQFKSPRRHASSLSAEPLVLPRLIIDLDAAESTFVRKVEEAPAPEEPQRSLLPIRRLGALKRMNPILIGDEHKRFRAQMFAIAFLLAEDEQHALQVLESVPLEHKDITLSEDTKTMRNWRPKSSPVSRKEVAPTPNSSNVWLLSLLYNHYDFHDCIPTPTLKKHLAETIVQLPHDPSLALEALKNLVLLDTDFTRHPAGSGRKAARFI